MRKITRLDADSVANNARRKSIRFWDERRGEGMRSLRILLVDDSDTVRAAGAELLRDEGHCVIEAKDGRESVELFLAAGVDAVIMDISMPRMNGVDAARRLRGLNDQVPIFAFTGVPHVPGSVDNLFAGVFTKAASFTKVCDALQAHFVD